LERRDISPIISWSLFDKKHVLPCRKSSKLMDHSGLSLFSYKGKFSFGKSFVSFKKGQPSMRRVSNIWLLLEITRYSIGINIRLAACILIK